MNKAGNETSSNIEIDKSSAEKALTIDFGLWMGRFDLAWKVGLIAFALSYAAGLFILNVHIRHHGANYFGFLEIEYVMVGILWMFLLAAVYGAHSAWRVVRISSVPRINKLRSMWRRTIANVVSHAVPIFIGYFSLSFLLLLLSAGEFPMFTLTSFSAVVNLAFTLFWLRAAFRGIRSILVPMATNSAPTTLEKKANLVELLQSAFYMILLAGTVGAYSLNVFPKLLSEYGGGRPLQLQLVIRTEDVDAVRSLGFNLKPDSRVLDVVPVVFEAQDFFLIVSPESTSQNIKTIRLRKDVVDSVIYSSGKQSR